MIGIGSDHGGFKLKEKILNELKEYNIKDYGTFNESSVDYPLFAFKVAEAIKNKEIEKGILICTTGIGISIAANKVKGIRCAKVDNLNEAKMTRLHNDANIIALNGSNDLGVEPVQDIFKRCEDFLDYIYDKHKGQNVLIVAHAATIRAIRHIVLKSDLNKNLLLRTIDNCFFEEIELKDK